MQNDTYRKSNTQESGLLVEIFLAYFFLANHDLFLQICIVF